MRIAPLAPAEYERAARRLLASADGSAVDSRAVREFLDSLQTEGMTFSAFAARNGDEWAGVAAAVELPGRTGIILIAPPGTMGLNEAGTRAAAQAAYETLAARRLHYVQCLVETVGDPRAALLRANGFGPLVTLDYLHRNPVYPWVEPPAGEFAWRTLADGCDEALRATILSTYEQSDDCPELHGLRPIDDVVASHRAAGRFDPALWQLAVRAHEVAGCMLLTETMTPGTFEVAYLGVVPAQRRAGVGAALVRRALQLCRERGAQELLIAVDARNVAALRLYAQFGFESAAQRAAWWRKTGSA